MAHYEQIGRKSVVNSKLCSCKPNKIKGLVVQGLHRRDDSVHVFRFTYLHVKLQEFTSLKSEGPTNLQFWCAQISSQMV